MPKSYHFDLGNSTKGHIGYCARIKATSEKEALKILRAVIPDELKILPCGTDKENASVQYIEAYFNGDAITVKNIDEVNEEE